MSFSAPFVVGVTGGIGSGKSTFARLLADLGGRHCDADQLARAATAPGSHALKAIFARYGDQVVSKGVLRRKALGAIVFRDPAERRWLEELVHPQIEALLEQAIRTGPWPLIYEATLLFEAGHDGFCDTTVTVTAPPAQVMARVAQRDALHAEEIRARIASQSPSSWREERATWVISNDNGLPELAEKARTLHARLSALHGSPKTPL